MKKIAHENTIDAQKKFKEIFDKNTKPTTLKPGTSVWLHRPKIGTGCQKLQKHNIGPYYIVSQTSPTNFTIREAKTNKLVGYPVHASRLKRCYENRDAFLTDYYFNQPQPKEPETANEEQEQEEKEKETEN